MLQISRDGRDIYPKVFVDSDNDVYMVVEDHCGNLRIMPLQQNGHIYSAKYERLDEILKQYPSFKEVVGILHIKEMPGC